jgi:hypothetical protein
LIPIYGQYNTKIATNNHNFFVFQVDMVKFSPEPPKESLLRLEPSDLSDLAVECFTNIMRYMGDAPMPPDVTEVKCVYTILMVSARNSLSCFSIDC